MKPKMKSTVRLCMSVIIAAAVLIPICPVAARASEPGRVTVVIGGGGIPGVSLTGDLIDGTTYVSVVDFAAAMGANGVRADDAVTAMSQRMNLLAAAGAQYIVANGNYLYVPTGCRDADVGVTAPLRTLAAAFGANVTWSNAFTAAIVTRGDAPIGRPSYTDDDVYWMSRIIQAEAGGESFEGKIAVGNVIMNRVDSPIFPGTVRDVIFDRRYNTIQFTPAHTGSIYNSPSGECIAAAHIALSGGASIVGDSLFFTSVTVSHCWASRNRERYGYIGNHVFYL